MVVPMRRLRLIALQVSLMGAVAGSVLLPTRCSAQAASATRSGPQRGTVKVVDGNNLTITTDAGQETVISVAADARIQRLAPGSTDLKTAEPATLPDVAVGDRILATGAPGDAPGSFNASRIILMKSSDIAQRHAAEQQDWQGHGTSGIVSAIDVSTGAISVSSGTRKLQVVTAPATTYRRYADGSVKFEDARPGTLADIHVGDQLLARGTKSDDGASVQATEIVSGSFKNLSGTILSVDAAKNAVSIKDLATKRNVTVQLTSSSALHRLPPQMAAMFAARSHGGGGASTGAPGSSASVAAPAGPAAATSGPSRPAAALSNGGGSPEGGHAGGSGRSGGGDLSQVVARLPAVPISDLHTGDAVMIVAEQSASDSGSLTAITLLAGVEPILAAAPSGSAAMTLSPWSVGSGAPEGGGSQ